MHFSWCSICTVGALVCPDLLHINRELRMISIWSLIPQVTMGGIKLPTGCTVNSLLSNSQTTVLSSAGYYHECLNLICLFSICLHLLFCEKRPCFRKLWLDQVCHFSVLDLENAAEWKIRLSCFCQLLLKPPEENKICMGRSIDVTHTGSTFKSTN